MKEQISALQQVPIPAVEHFASATGNGEKRSAWRDYKLFGVGFIVSTAIAIVLKLNGLG